jgi:Holliday junction resolvase RusA-like endonuclease
MREGGKVKFTIDINPMGTVRTTHNMIKRIKYYNPTDAKALKVMEYLSYKEKLSWEARKYFKGEPISGPVMLDLTFYIPMPESWSEKKKQRMDGKHHISKPDRDNLEKGVSDSFNKIIWKDDGQVCDGPIRKFYSRTGRIEIEITEVTA